MVSILPVDLISCYFLTFCTYVVASTTWTYAKMFDILQLEGLKIPGFYNPCCTVFGENDYGKYIM